jgi:uncharacterized membrane protein YgdD (TMEM256/DUF423 family)
VRRSRADFKGGWNVIGTQLDTLGAVTPLGGVAFIAGWLPLAYRLPAR